MRLTVLIMLVAVCGMSVSAEARIIKKRAGETSPLTQPATSPELGEVQSSPLAGETSQPRKRVKRQKKRFAPGDEQAAGASSTNSNEEEHVFRKDMGGDQN